MINIIFENNKALLYKKFLNFLSCKRLRAAVRINEDESFNTLVFLYKENQTYKLRHKAQKRLILNVSRLISDFVITYLCEHAIIKRNITNQTKEQPQIILRKIKYRILFDSSKSKDKQWAKIINQRITDHLTRSHNITLSAFINFRTYDLKEYIEAVINEMLSLINEEKQYNEFISAMQLLVENRPSKAQCINIYPCENGYLLKDNLGKDIPYQEPYNTGFTFDKTKNSDELLISTLIAISPKQIRIHDNSTFLTSDVFAVINNIFSERVYLCYDNNTILKP